MERREDPSENTKENEKTNYVTTIPEEIWLCIFEFFDFKTLQKLLTLVCKEWFRIIRQSLKFSGQLNIIPGTKLSDINLMLNSWKAIRVLQVARDVELENLDVTPCLDLEKVLIFGCFTNEDFNHISNHCIPE